MNLSELLAMLDRLADMTTDELDELRSGLNAAFDELREGDTTADTVADLQRIVEGVEQIEAEVARRDTEAAELQEQVADLERRLRGEDGDGDDDESDDAEGDGDAEADDDASADSDAGDGEATDDDDNADAEGERVPVTAASPPARTPIARIRERQPAAARPRSRGQSGPVLRAAPDLPNVPAGAAFSNWREAAAATLDRLHSFRGEHHGPTQMVRVGTVDYSDQYGDDRWLRETNSPAANTALVAAVVTPEDALIAAGGLCAPADVRYDLPTVSAIDRPLRGGLPSFRADRGALKYNSPSTLADIVVDNTDGAIDTITVADDAGGATKTVQTVSCGDEQEVKVTAITERLKFGNFADRYNPERMEQWQRLARAAHARRAERLLLAAIDAASTQVNGGPVELGAARQIVANLLVAAVRYRYRHRMPEDATLRVVLPMWAGELVMIDLLWQQPGDGITTARLEGRRWITEKLADANVVPIWQRDDLSDTVMSAAQSTGALLDFPGQMESYLFHEGAFLHLDGGTLDFGIVRDATLNAANRFESFYESFENVAFVGIESLAITHNICANGATSLPIAAGCGGAGSA